MRVAVVGSRTFPQMKLVEWFIRDLPHGVTIVSGGAPGVDQAAVDYATRRGLETREHLADTEGCTQRHEFTKRYYERNEQIVQDADLVVAFTERDSGGTWDTIKRARRHGVALKVIRPSAFTVGDSDDAEDAEGQLELERSPQQLARDERKGKGPFAIKRVSLGSYALRRKCYIEPEEWAELVTLKDSDPEGLAERMMPAFLEFFEQNHRFGFVHAITVPPKSIRNAERVHVMDVLAQRLAEALGTEFVQVFEPWEKATRGRHAKRGELTVLPEAARMVGQVVWVLDDITTTNYTLRAAVQGLMALEVHAHGLAYVVMG